MTGVKLMLTRLVQVPANTEFETYNIRDETTIASRLENRENDETEKLKKNDEGRRKIGSLPAPRPSRLTPNFD